MNYLLDKRIKRKKFFKIAMVAVSLIVLFFLRSVIFSGLSYATNGVFRPVLSAGNSIGGKFSAISSYFISKKSLYLQNQILQSKLDENNARMVNYNSLNNENVSLKEILGRKDAKSNMILSAILSKPNQSLYDTLVIDAGVGEGIKTGDIVFALGNIPIGRVEIVYAHSSKVVLFTNNREKTRVVVSGKDIFMEIVGRGGGNFEMILPRDFILQKGDQVVMPGINSYVIAIVQTIISDPRDPFIKALLISPVNVQELKFVQIVSQN